MAEKKKEAMTPEEKKQHRKEEFQSTLIAIGFCLALLLGFGLYAMQSSLFGG